MRAFPPDGPAFFFAKGIEAVCRADLVQRHAMRVVEVVGRRFILAKPQHPAKRLPSHFVCEAAPVFLDPVFGADVRHCCAESGMPIQDRAARIKGQRFNLTQAHM